MGKVEDIMKNLFTDKYDVGTKLDCLRHLDVEDKLVEYMQKYYPEFVYYDFCVKEYRIRTFLLRLILEKKWSRLALFIQEYPDWSIWRYLKNEEKFDK